MLWDRKKEKLRTGARVALFSEKGVWWPRKFEKQSSRPLLVRLTLHTVIQGSEKSCMEKQS